MLRHAAVVAAAARNREAALRAEDPPELLRLTPVDDDDNGDDTDSVSSVRVSGGKERPRSLSARGGPSRPMRRPERDVRALTHT